MEKLHDIGLDSDMLDKTPKYRQWKKNRQIGLHKNSKLLYIKKYYQQSKMVTQRMRKNICNHIPDYILKSRKYKVLKINDKKMLLFILKPSTDWMRLDVIHVIENILSLLV
jgi:hypothetical protein